MRIYGTRGDELNQMTATCLKRGCPMATVALDWPQWKDTKIIYESVITKDNMQIPPGLHWQQPLLSEPWCRPVLWVHRASVGLPDQRHYRRVDYGCEPNLLDNPEILRNLWVESQLAWWNTLMHYSSNSVTHCTTFLFYINVLFHSSCCNWC